MSHLVNSAVEKRRTRLLKARANVRKTFPPEAELRALARSVMKRQLHPLIILPADFILDGECRWRGLMLENPDFEVDVIVVDRELTAGEVQELQLISALHSTALTPYDQALACKEWLERNPGATSKELAVKIERDPSMLTRLNALWTTIAPVVTAAAQQRIGPKAWYQISLLPHADQAGLLDMYLSGMPAAQIAAVSRTKRNGTASTVKVSRIKVPVPGTTATVLVTGEAITLQDMLDALTEVLREGKKACERGLDAKTFERVCRDLARKRVNHDAAPRPADTSPL